MDKVSFLTDAMLGGLTRWLRVLSYDTRFNPAQSDHELVTIADNQGRTLLTRDRHLITFLRPQRGVLIQHQNAMAQLKQVVHTCNLSRPERLFSRCTLCNTLLQPPSTKQQGHLPEDVVLSETSAFCPKCQKLYWPGSHTRRMCITLMNAFPDWLPSETTKPWV